MIDILPKSSPLESISSRTPLFPPPIKVLQTPPSQQWRNFQRGIHPSITPTFCCLSIKILRQAKAITPPPLPTSPSPPPPVKYWLEVTHSLSKEKTEAPDYPTPVTSLTAAAATAADYPPTRKLRLADQTAATVGG